MRTSTETPAIRRTDRFSLLSSTTPRREDQYRHDPTAPTTPIQYFQIQQYKLWDHQYKLRDHLCGCRGGNRYEKGNLKKWAIN